jgi:catechol 2,3-dioxygenase-like lactoylglutathione lyase family enzyme
MNLNQVTIPVIDVEKSIEFYKKLGLILIVESLPHYARFQCPNGNATFSLHRVDQLPSGEGIWVYFESEKLDIYVQLLLNKGVIFEELPNDKPWLWREARLKDADNNQIILYFAGTNRTNPPWKIVSPSLIC